MIDNKTTEEILKSGRQLVKDAEKALGEPLKGYIAGKDITFAERKELEKHYKLLKRLRDVLQAGKLGDEALETDLRSALGLLYTLL